MHLRFIRVRSYPKSHLLEQAEVVFWLLIPGGCAWRFRSRFEMVNIGGFEGPVSIESECPRRWLAFLRTFGVEGTTYPRSNRSESSDVNILQKHQV